MDLDLKISVIIPVYNAQETIEQTLQSITTQSYCNIEIILVNDGSIDKSYEICKKIALTDSRIKIINKENGGVASARNFGINNATGEYIIHADSDDTVLPNAYLNLIKEAKKSNADIVVGGYYAGVENNFTEIIPHNSIKDPIVFVKNILENKVHAGLWNKLVAKELYRDFKFVEGLDYKEDLIFFVTQSMKKKPKISIIKNPVYFYYLRNGSITNNNFDKTIEKKICAVNFLESLKYNELEDCLRFQKAYINIQFILNRKNSIYKYEDFYSDLGFWDLNIPMKYKILLFFERFSISWLSVIYLKIKALKK